METQVRDVLERIGHGSVVRWLALTGREARTNLATEQPAWIQNADIERTTGWSSRGAALSRVNREISRFRPDVIHSRGYNATLLAQIANLSRKPTIFDPRSLMPLERVAYGRTSMSSARTQLWLILERWMVRVAAATVGVSPPMSDYFRKRAPKSLIQTIPLAVDVERMGRGRHKRDALRHELAVASSEVLVVYAGSLSLGEAGLDVLARVMMRIHRGTKARFLCLTRDDPEPLLAATVRAGGPPIDLLAGRYEDMPGWLAAADWGLVIRSPRNPRLLNEVVLTTKFPEYLASGLPVVVNNATTWLVRLITELRLGIRVGEDEGDPIALEPWTTEERDRLRSYAEANHGIDSIAGSYLALYEKICSPT